MKSLYQNECPLQLCSRLNPLATGGKYYTEKLPGRSPSESHCGN